MGSVNTSDLIENHLKELLKGCSQIEIRRTELAEVFSVVPSQINYVIKTRFTREKGYDILSKRGGGGYIKISKIEYSDHHTLLMDLYEKMPDLLDGKTVKDIIQFLYQEKVITFREGELARTLMDDLNFEAAVRDRERALMMKAFLQRLDRKDEIK